MEFSSSTPLITSLRKHSLVTAAQSLWKSQAYQTYYAHQNDTHSLYRNITDYVLPLVPPTMIPSLQLPPSIADEISDLLRNMEIQWIRFVCWLRRKLLFDLVSNSLTERNDIYWTSEGELDVQRIAAKCLETSRKSSTSGGDINTAEQRFNLACHFNLEIELRQIWSEIPFSNTDFKSYFRRNFNPENLDFSWFYWIGVLEDNFRHFQGRALSGDLQNPDGTELTVYEQMIVSTFNDPNISAFEYFVNKMKPRVLNSDKFVFYLDIAKSSFSDYLSRYIFWALSSLSAPQQIELIRQNPRFLVPLFGDLTTIGYAFSILDHFWDVLRQNNGDVFIELVRKFEGIYGEQFLADIRREFTKLWLKTPPDLKRVASEDGHFNFLFFLMKKFDDFELIEFYLEEARPEVIKGCIKLDSSWNNHCWYGLAKNETKIGNVDKLLEWMRITPDDFKQFKRYYPAYGGNPKCVSYWWDTCQIS